MLRNILHKTRFTGNNRFRAIVYVGDKANHIEHVCQAFCKQPVELDFYHYTHETKRVNEFINSDTTKMNEKWQKIKEILKLVQ